MSDPGVYFSDLDLDFLNKNSGKDPIFLAKFQRKKFFFSVLGQNETDSKHKPRSDKIRTGYILYYFI